MTALPIRYEPIYTTPGTGTVFVESVCAPGVVTVPYPYPPGPWTKPT